MKVTHRHETVAIAAVIRRPDGSLSDGQYGCWACGTIFNFIAGRWYVIRMIVVPHRVASVPMDRVPA